MWNLPWDVFTKIKEPLIMGSRKNGISKNRPVPVLWKYWILSAGWFWFFENIESWESICSDSLIFFVLQKIGQFRGFHLEEVSFLWLIFKRKPIGLFNWLSARTSHQPCYSQVFIWVLTWFLIHNSSVLWKLTEYTMHVFWAYLSIIINYIVCIFWADRR